MPGNNNFEVIVIGGSYGGLSAAMSLGRALRRVLIVDNGLPCNRQTPHSHNFITQDGKTPKEISALAKEKVTQYKTVQFYSGRAVKATKKDKGFEIKTESGDLFYSCKLIIATGLKDLMPGITGFAECWGISMVHCPYCHGYELRNKKTGIMANGERAFHLASLVNNLTGDITILTSGKADFKPQQIEKLNSHHIKIIETEVAEIEHQNGSIKNVIFRNGNSESFEGIYASLPFTQHSDIPVSLGCELTEHGYIKVDDFQNTTVARLRLRG